MAVLSKFRLRSLREGKGAAYLLPLALVAGFFLVAGCKKAPPPAPVVKISPDAVHVTAISLGNPRLAIINGKQLGEGDELVASAARLRITKISDGEIELSNGAQVILARLETPKPPPPKR